MKRVWILGLAACMLLLAFPSNSANAATYFVSFSGISGGACDTTGVSGVMATMSWNLPTEIARNTLSYTYKVNGVQTMSGTGQPFGFGGSGSVPAGLGGPAGVALPYEIVADQQYFVDGDMIAGTRLTFRCAVGNVLTVLAENYAATGTFSGPALPGIRNLVLFYADTPILDGPDGKPTGKAMKACQTGFIIGSSGDFSQVYLMGGWVPAKSWTDVPETYGQPGTPVDLGCIGR